MNTTLSEGVKTLRVMLDEGRITHHEWSGLDSQGRQTLCLLGALCGTLITSTGACPATLLPPWLAALTPWIDDVVSDSCRPAMCNQFLKVMEHAATCNVDWRLAKARFIRTLLITAVLRLSEKVNPDIQHVIELYTQLIDGGNVTNDDWYTAHTSLQRKPLESTRPADMVALTVRENRVIELAKLAVRSHTAGGITGFVEGVVREYSDRNDGALSTITALFNAIYESCDNSQLTTRRNTAKETE